MVLSFFFVVLVISVCACVCECVKRRLFSFVFH